MLYLIRTFGRSPKSRYLKVGQTDSVEDRFRTYRVQNPFFEPVSLRQGDEYEETLLHLYLTAQGLKAEFMNEWFLDCPEVLSEFHAPLEKQKRWVWRFRDLVFKPSDFKGRGDKLRERIYEDLRLEHREENLDKPIDRVWKQESNKKLLKQLKQKLDNEW